MRRPRGFTLIELIVSMTIVLLAIALAGAGFAAQNQALQAFDLSRIANSASRDALLNVEGSLRIAGWGVDPRYALDLRGTAVSTVDSASGPDSLVFMARNPMYQWVQEGGACTFTGVGGCPGTCTAIGGCHATGGNSWVLQLAVTGAQPQITINLAAGQVIEKGRTVIVTCLGGERPVMVTSTSRLTGPLAGAVITGETTPSFPYNEDLGGFTNTPPAVCHNATPTTSAVFLVDRYRYFIQPYAGVPWLMLDTGLDLDLDGTVGNAADWIPVARNVEDLQVAYILTGTGPGPDLGTTPSTTGNWIVGDDPGTVELPVGPATSTTSPLYTDLRTHPSRLTTASANVHGVRISVVLRSARTDQNQDPNWPGDDTPAFENRPAVPHTDRLRRWAASTDITLRNMDSVRNFTF